MLCFLLVGKRRKEKKTNKQTKHMGRLFSLGPEARHALLAVPLRIFSAVRYN
jgi:hypothetical protein